MKKFVVVEKHFEYRGHDCICLFNYMGYRCGYVSVDEVKDYKEFDIACHCGLTFGAEQLNKDYNPKKDYYIGFDCGHICDGHDYTLARAYGLIDDKMYDEFIQMDIQSSVFLMPVRDLEYVENQCKKIVDQLEDKR